VFNVHVTKPQLKPPRIVARVREQMAARVSQHVRMALLLRLALVVLVFHAYKRGRSREMAQDAGRVQPAQIDTRQSCWHS
jgi:hypothetical protein